MTQLTQDILKTILTSQLAIEEARLKQLRIRDDGSRSYHPVLCIAEGQIGAIEEIKNQLKKLE